jgi:putative ABC transport system permease protein
MVLFSDHAGTIVGVMKNFHNEPLFSDIREYALMLGNSFNYLSLQISTQDISGTIDLIEETLLSIEPEYLFSFRFLDEEIRDKYYREVLIGRLTGGLALLSVLISILGIIGLVLFTLKKQSKEIAVRKVNGASTADILIMLNTGFNRWVLVSFIIASPLAYIALRQWYENFAYRTTISGWIFILAGLCVFSITSVIVNIQCIKYARQNPASTLQHE